MTEPQQNFRDTLNHQPIRSLSQMGIDAIRHSITQAITESPHLGSTSVLEYDLIKCRPAFLWWCEAEVEVHPLLKDLIEELKQQGFRVRIFPATSRHYPCRMCVYWDVPDDKSPFIAMQPPDFTSQKAEGEKNGQ